MSNHTQNHVTETFYKHWFNYNINETLV